MKKIYLGILTLILLILPATAADFKTCNTFYTDQKYQNACNCFKELVQKDGNNVQARFYYAASLYYNRQFAQSYEQYNYIAQKYSNSQIGQYSKKEAQKVYKRMQSVQQAKQNDTGNYVNNLEKTAKWQKMPIKVWIQDSPYKNTAKKAFGEWEVKSNKTVSFILVPNPNFAQIKVVFVNSISDKFDDSNIGLTTAKISGNTIKSAKVQILQRTDSGKMRTYNQIYPVILHEIGHALGMTGHSTRNNDIMYENNLTNDDHLSNRDINTLKAIYKK